MVSDSRTVRPRLGARALSSVLCAIVLLSTGAAVAFEPLSLDGVSVEGRIESNEEWIPPGEPRSDPLFNRQVYTFEVPAGETVDLWVTAEFDAFVVLYREDGTRIAEGDDFTSQFDARIAVNLEVPGRYFFIVTSLMPERAGGFTLVARSLGVGAPLPPDYVEAGPAALGWPDLEMWPAQPLQGEERRGELGDQDDAEVRQPAAAALPATPRDVHVLAGEAGTMVSLDLSAQFDAVLYLVGTEGALLAWNEDYSTLNHSRLVDVVLPETGDYQVVVAVSEIGAGRGAYVLTIGEARPAPAFSPDRTIVFGEAVASELGEGDRARVYGIADRVGLEFFREALAFEAEAGQSVELVVDSDFGAYLYWLDPDGATMDSGGDFGGQGRLDGSMTFPRSGRYRLIVSSANPREGGIYRLELRPSSESP